MVFALILAFLVIIALEAPRLVREKMWRELGAFAVIMVFAMVLSTAAVLKIPLPNPTKGLELVFKPVSDAIFQALK